MDNLEQVKADLEERILAIEGVVGFGIGLDAAENRCLKIYTSLPVDQVRNQLPAEIDSVAFELEYVGEIKAQ